jgi:micrococcal nuclease
VATGAGESVPVSEVTVAEEPVPVAGDCDPSYLDLCIPPGSADLNCDDIGVNNFTVLPPDPHGFDNDGDGVGCESP